MLANDQQVLEHMVRWAKIYGWTGDYIEVCQFIVWVYQQYGLVPPTPEQLQPVDDQL